MQKHHSIFKCTNLNTATFRNTLSSTCRIKWKVNLVWLKCSFPTMAEVAQKLTYLCRKSFWKGRQPTRVETPWFSSKEREQWELVSGLTLLPSMILSNLVRCCRKFIGPWRLRKYLCLWWILISTAIYSLAPPFHNQDPCQPTLATFGRSMWCHLNSKISK